jgi:hypothetical protein
LLALSASSPSGINSGLHSVRSQVLRGYSPAARRRRPTVVGASSYVRTAPQTGSVGEHTQLGGHAPSSRLPMSDRICDAQPRRGGAGAGGADAASPRGLGRSTGRPCRPAAPDDREGVWRAIGYGSPAADRPADNAVRRRVPRSS